MTQLSSKELDQLVCKYERLKKLLDEKEKLERQVKRLRELSFSNDTIVVSLGSGVRIDVEFFEPYRQRLIGLLESELYDRLCEVLSELSQVGLTFGEGE